MTFDLKHLSFLTLYIVCLCILPTSNANLGLAADESDAWKYLYLLCFCGLILIPILAVFFVLKSRHMALEYQERLQKKLNISLIVLVVLMLLAELSLMPSTNIRVDLLLVIPALVLHGIIFSCSHSILKASVKLMIKRRENSCDLLRICMYRFSHC